MRAGTIEKALDLARMAYSWQDDEAIMNAFESIERELGPSVADFVWRAAGDELVKSSTRSSAPEPADQAQTTIFDFLDADQPGALCRYSAAVVEGRNPIPEPPNGGWVDHNRYVCYCRRSCTVRTDGRLPRHYVPSS